jgi:hypothetical protein
MSVEAQAIAELFRDPRRTQRMSPFTEIISRTRGRGEVPYSQGGDLGPPGPKPGPGMPPPPPGFGPVLF